MTQPPRYDAHTMATAGEAPEDELREFLMVLRQALLMVVSWIERRYGLVARHR